VTYLDPLAAMIRAHVAPGVGIPEDADQLFLIYALLARAKGASVTTRDVHDAWVVWMQGRGEQHPSIVPFERLDAATQLDDEPFAAAIRTAVDDEDAVC
jgi:hypothetical protein